MEDLLLAQLLCSRLCHDLVGPVGAVGNGIEMLQEDDDPGMREQALSLVSHSVEQASRRLRFYRLAFGAAAGTSQVALGEAEALTRDFFEGGRVKLDWQVPADRRLSRDAGKLLLNLLLTGAEAMPRGGLVTVAAMPSGNGVVLSVLAVGQGTALSEDAARALGQDHGTAELAAKVAPARLARRLAAALGGELAIEAAENRLRLSFAVPD